jgi:site-specific DNA-cytosine methylase
MTDIGPSPACDNKMLGISEIDNHAIKVTQFNLPDTIQLGDITKWREWGIDWSSIDIITFGSPCQDISVAGKQAGLDGSRSGLFFVAVDVLNHIKALNSKLLFLVENVKMKKEWENIFTENLGVDPILIDSSLLSAQMRKRLYWTNIPNITQPKNIGLRFKDIIEKPTGIIGSMRGRRLLNGVRKDYSKIEIKQYLEIKEQTKTNCLSSVSKDNIVLLDTNDFNKIIDKFNRVDPKLAEWRYLTPIECERLQTLPDNYTECVSNSQRYKALGNGWTVDVVAHIFKEVSKCLSIS